MLHQLEHGLAWRFAEDVSGWTCDHADHGDALERAASDALDDDCLLCTRHDRLTSEVPVVLADAAAGRYVRLAPAPLASRPNSGLLPIRGPPALS